MNLFYVPVPNPQSYKNYENSILSCIAHDNKKLNDVMHSNGLYGLWGFKPGFHNNREYEKINIGDIIFFRINDEKHQAFDGFGFISNKLKDSAIGKQVWGDPKYSLLITINKFYRFYEPFRLSFKGENVASIAGISDEIWHERYDMFRQWNMPNDAAKLLINHLSSDALSLELYLDNENSIEINQTDYDSINDNDIETERFATRKERKGQDKFKKDLLKHNNKCEICGINDEKLLIGSHIKSWKASKNKERLDKNNGLLLCAMHDKLFDKGFISFSNEGKIKISSALSEKNKRIIGLSANTYIDMNERKKEYMKWHKENTYMDGV